MLRLSKRGVGRWADCRWTHYIPIIRRIYSFSFLCLLLNFHKYKFCFFRCSIALFRITHFCLAATCVVASYVHVFVFSRLRLTRTATVASELVDILWSQKYIIMAIMGEQKKSKLYFLFSSRSIMRYLACNAFSPFAAAWLAYNSRKQPNSYPNTVSVSVRERAALMWNSHRKINHLSKYKEKTRRRNGGKMFRIFNERKKKNNVLLLLMAFNVLFVWL